MKEAKLDLFDCILDEKYDAICITTNSHYQNGIACMGGGSARGCIDRWPQTGRRLATCLKNFGTNVPFIIGATDRAGRYLEPSIKMIRERAYKCLIFSFPTIDDLMEGAKLSLVRNSAKEMRTLADKYQLLGIVIGRPAVGIGGKLWADVKPLLEPHFDDRFTVVSFDHEE
jgi:hypothetical protein